MRRTFIVGKFNRKASEIIVVDGVGASPIPGPWTLRALVRSNPPCPAQRVSPGSSSR
ncbi:MAG: hypothetical protein PVJ76_13895 [Gemmatimonadota bacterium]|jgi:hypothetical protein